MTENRTRQDFLAFLDWMSEKGLMAKNTVVARKAAANKVLGILSNEEAQDVTVLDLDTVMRRFTNLEGKGYTPGSLTTYFSRLRSALDDFRLYLDKPLSFRPGVQPREPRKSEARKETPSAAPIASGGTGPLSTPNTLSIPIRPNTMIVIHGLPYDLNEAEATKIANVIRAMVTPAS
jgi:hypothetical protein